MTPQELEQRLIWSAVLFLAAMGIAFMLGCGEKERHFYIPSAPDTVVVHDTLTTCWPPGHCK